MSDDLRFFQSPTVLQENKKSAIKYTEHFHRKYVSNWKHVDIWSNYIMEPVRTGCIRLLKFTMDNMLTSLLDRSLWKNQSIVELQKF